MLAEPLHKVGVVAADAVHRKRPQHEPHFGRDTRRNGGVGSVGPQCRLSAGFRRSARPVHRPFENAKFDLGHEFFGRRRRLHAIVPVQQIPERLVDAQRARHIALLGMHAHQMAAGFFVGGVKIDDRRRDIFFIARSDILRHQPGCEASHQPLLNRLALRQNPDPK
jgi:hypothetical protein